MSSKLLAFIEHPLFLAAFSVLGGIVGLIYTPFLIITVFCIVGAFHRAGVVTGQKLTVQIPAYLAVFIISTGIVYGAIRLIKSSVHIPTAQEIARELKSILPAPQVTNVYTPAQSPPQNGTVILKEHSFLAFQGPPQLSFTYMGRNQPSVFVGWNNKGGRTPVELEDARVSAQVVSWFDLITDKGSFTKSKFKQLLAEKSAFAPRLDEADAPDGQTIPIQGWRFVNSNQEKQRVGNAEDTVLVMARIKWRDEIDTHTQDYCFSLVPPVVAGHFGASLFSTWQKCNGVGNDVKPPA